MSEPVPPFLLYAYMVYTKKTVTCFNSENHTEHVITVCEESMGLPKVSHVVHMVNIVIQGTNYASLCYVNENTYIIHLSSCICTGVLPVTRNLGLKFHPQSRCHVHTHVHARSDTQHIPSPI